MKLLCLSNGHGEDVIAVRILQALQQQPDPPQLAALPIVGEGRAYREIGIPIVGAVQAMPSGGFVYMDGRQLVRDLQGGLLQLTWAQLRAVRAWAREGGAVLAVGDIVPLLFAWWSGADYAFVGTAKSEYYLRDEQGWLPRRTWFERFESWSGSVYLPWERWLMRRSRCKAVFPRDSLTSTTLRKWQIPACDLGNPMMDGLEATGAEFPVELDASEADYHRLTFVLLPGSRAPEAYQNWQTIIQAVASLVMALEQQRQLLFLGAIAPQLEVAPLRQLLEAYGWRPSDSRPSDSRPSDSRLADARRLTATDAALPLVFKQYRATLVLTRAFSDCLHQADIALAMTGTGVEQFVGFGKPAITFPGNGPQFTFKFAEAQTRLLGAGVTLVEQPNRVVGVVQSLLQDPDRLQWIQANGTRRMGTPGAAIRIAEHLMQLTWTWPEPT